jgi:hypothetical protein
MITPTAVAVILGGTLPCLVDGCIGSRWLMRRDRTAGHAQPKSLGKAKIGRLASRGRRRAGDVFLGFLIRPVGEAWQPGGLIAPYQLGLRGGDRPADRARHGQVGGSILSLTSGRHDVEGHLTAATGSSP